MTNPNITDDSVLILVKESFGNPLPAFLCDHYSTIYIIDYRSWYGNIIDFAREVHADDLLFANNINSLWIKCFNIYRLYSGEVSD